MLKSLFNRTFRIATLIKRCLQHRCFSVEFAKFLRTPILKKTMQTTASEGLFQFHQNCPFLIPYISGSNWYICHSVCIIISSFVCQFFLHYYNQKQLSDDVLQKRCSYKFRRNRKKKPVLNTCF